MLLLIKFIQYDLSLSDIILDIKDFILFFFAQSYEAGFIIL